MRAQGHRGPALLQLPILLRTNVMGHGGGTPLSERIAEDVDVFAFLFHELGVKYRPVKK